MQFKVVLLAQIQSKTHMVNLYQSIDWNKVEQEVLEGAFVLNELRFQDIISGAE